MMWWPESDCKLFRSFWDFLATVGVTLFIAAILTVLTSPIWFTIAWLIMAG